MKKHWPYRFKTEKEMIDTFGDTWWGQMNWAYTSMNYLLGIPFEYEIKGDIDFNKSNQLGHFTFGHSSWSIESCMLTNNIPIKPNYNPKTFIRN